MNITELNNLRKIICLRKSEVSVERISVCSVMSLKTWRSMDYTVCYALVPVAS